MGMIGTRKRTTWLLALIACIMALFMVSAGPVHADETVKVSSVTETTQDDSIGGNIVSFFKWLVPRRAATTDTLTGTAYAVLTGDAGEELDFIRSTETHTNEEIGSVVSVSGSTYSGVIYTGFETESYDSDNKTPWNAALTSIKTVKFVDKIKPTSTAYWFSGMTKCTSMDLANLDTSTVTTMENMFSGCSGLTTLDVSKFDTSNVTDMGAMFARCTSLESLDLSNFDTSSVTDLTGMMTNCAALKSLNVKSFDLGKVTTINSIFSGDKALTSETLAQSGVLDWDTSNIQDMTNAFGYCTGLTTLDLSKWNTSSMTKCSSFMDECTGLTNINISGWDFKKCAGSQMGSMMEDTTNLKSLDMSNCDMSTGGQYLNAMHSADWTNLESVNLSGLKAEGIQGAYNFLKGAKITSLDLSGLNFANCSGMNNFASDCSLLKTVNLTNTTFTGVLYGIFSNCPALSQVITTNMDTAGVTWYGTMFQNCPSLHELDLSSWNTAKATGFNKFADGSGLNKIIIGNNVISGSGFFPTPATTASGKTSNGLWGRDSELVDAGVEKVYTASELDSYGSTAGALTGTWYAQAEPTYYTVRFDANKGSGTMASEAMTYDTAKALTANTFTRSGYTFNGWNTKADGSGTAYADKTSVKNLTAASGGSVTLYAQWTANTNTKYTVIHQQEQLDGTYKTVDTQNLTGTTDTSVTPAVKSYTGFTAPSTQTITIKGDGTASVTYKYTRNSYTVTRQYRLQNADGSYNSYMQIDSKSYKYGTSIAAWTRSADDTYKAASIAVHTVAAKNETLSVNVDRKTASVALQYRLQNADGTYPTSFTSGWTGTLRVGENHTWAYTQTTSHSAVSKTVTYGDGTVSVDVPRRTGRLVIKANGGSSDRTTAAIRYGSTSDTISPLPTRTGYTLTGLYTTATGGTKVVNASGTMANDGTYSTDGTWLLNSDVTVYAQWTVNTYKISYTLNGGTNASGNPSSYTIESDAISLAAPTRTGYTFTGWTGSNGTTAQTSVTIAKGSTGDKNYTANWKANSYTVKFDANGGTGTITDEDFTYDQSKALSANTFKRKFYTFAGWNIKKDGSGTQYADLASAKNLATSGDVTLYAQWTANTYTVSIPTAINYKNMQTGAVSTSNSYDITVKNQTGSFGDTVKVQAANGELNAANGSSDKLTATAGSSSSPLPFTEDGSKQDSISITGTTHTADKWTGSVQYSVTIE